MKRFLKFFLILVIIAGVIAGAIYGYSRYTLSKPAPVTSASNWMMDYVPNQVYFGGNVVSDEPGYYREGAFGVRVENLLVLRRTAGRRFYFETLTLAPYEPEAILTDQLSDDDIAWVNRYHGNVYRKLSPYLTDDEAAWLKEQTKPF